MCLSSSFFCKFDKGIIEKYVKIENIEITVAELETWHVVVSQKFDRVNVFGEILQRLNSIKRFKLPSANRIPGRQKFSNFGLVIIL